MEKYVKKDSRDVKKEYGLYLRWINGGGDDAGNTWDITMWIENIYDSEKEIYYLHYRDGSTTNEDAYNFILKKTVNAFRDKSSVDCYNNYVKLFEIMGIKKLKGLNGVLEEKGITVTQLSKKTGIPQSTINNMYHKEYEFQDTSVEKAIKMANALEMNVEELYNEIYFKRIGDEITKMNIKSSDIKTNSLKGLLEERSLSNTKFSKLTNIARTTISSLVHNDYEFKNTSVKNAIKMASVLEINTEDLYNAIENIIK